MATKARERPAAALSPERQALASAIDALSQHQERIARLRAADDRTYDAIRDADDRLADARKAIEEGKAARTRDLVEGTNKAPTAAALRLANQEAADDLETTRAAREQIAAELTGLESWTSHRESSVRQAAVAVLAIEAGDEIAGLLKRMVALRLEHLTIAQELNWMTKHGIEAVPQNWAIDWGKVPDGAADKWQRMLDALMQDPAAPVLS